MAKFLTTLSICLLVMVSGCISSNDEPDTEQVETATPTNTTPSELNATETREAELGELATIQAERTATEIDKSDGSSTSIAEIVETSTLEPTATLTPLSTAMPTDTPEPTESPEIDLVAKLPTLNDLPPGYSVRQDQEFTSTDLAAGYLDPEAHLNRLESWGFQVSYIRAFEIPSPGLNDLIERTILFDCVVSQYGSPEQVQEASRFALDRIKSREGWDIQEVSAESIGDWTLAAQGTDNTGTQSFIWTFVYAQADDIQFQCRGASGTHNSLQEVADLVKLMISR